MGKSVSRLVADCFALTDEGEHRPVSSPPGVQELFGVLAGGEDCSLRRSISAMVRPYSRGAADVEGSGLG